MLKIVLYKACWDQIIASSLMHIFLSIEEEEEEEIEEEDDEEEEAFTSQL